MENNNKPIEYLTRKDLEEQTRVILEAFDNRFNGVEKELKETKEDLRTDINNVQTLIDGYVKAQEDFKQDFVVIKEEVRQMKQIIKEKLGIEIKAI